MIRWQGSISPLFALYKNFGLLACFAGLGLGYAISSRRSLPLVLTLPLLLWQMAILVLMKSLGGRAINVLHSTPVLEQLNMGIGTAISVRNYAAVMLLLTVSFMLTALAFVPVGQLCGRLMDRRDNKLKAYGLNLLGSLLGVLLMFGLSYLWTPPVTWFAPCFVSLLTFQTFDKRVLLFGAACGLTAAIVLTWPTTFLWEQTYSPYQLLQRGPGERELSLIKAAGHYYQRIHDLSSGRVNGPEGKYLRPIANYYEFPYKVAGEPGVIAIVGAGTGNDVAAALRMGAEEVDAIEIDPAIMAYGVAYHPELPYQSQRVHRIVNDARTYMRMTHRMYDMVVFGLLDSHTLLSNASSVRLDSFVYTIEAFREARSLLRDQGILSLSFCVLSPELGRKFYLMLQQAFDGQPPVCIKANYDGSIIFLERKGSAFHLDPALLKASGCTDVTALYADPALLADVSTDDWPFLYMPRRVYPVSYLVVLGLLLTLSLALVGLLSPARPRPQQVPFLLLGAGFMLVETKSITELGLTFGNTWHVIGIVIAGILSMAFLANFAVQRLRIERITIPYLLLLASLALGWVISIRGGFPSTIPGRLTALVVLTCPLFFSGLIFSTMLRSGVQISGIMAANLIAVVCGGLLEYNSMYFGFRCLYLLAMAIYGSPS